MWFWMICFLNVKNSVCMSKKRASKKAVAVNLDGTIRGSSPQGKTMKLNGMIAAVALCGSMSAMAYTPNGLTSNVTAIIAWEAPIATVMIEFSDSSNAANKHYCYFDGATSHGKTLLALVTSAYLANRSVYVFCNDTASNVNGYATARTLHRISMLPLN